MVLARQSVRSLFCACERATQGRPLALRFLDPSTLGLEAPTSLNRPPALPTQPPQRRRRVQGFGSA
eukprot:12032067-Alexandrium_andersonii.AAC.1